MSVTIKIFSGVFTQTQGLAPEQATRRKMDHFYQEESLNRTGLRGGGGAPAEGQKKNWGHRTESNKS